MGHNAAPMRGHIAPRLWLLTQAVPGCWTDLVLEVLHDAGSGCSAVDEDEAHASVRGGHAKPGQDVGPGPLPQGNAELDPQLVEHSGQVLADLLHGREGHAAGEAEGISCINVVVRHNSMVILTAW